MKKTIAVVVTYNRLQLLKKTIAALLEQTYQTDVLIVDNASTDETFLWAQECAAQNQGIYYHNTGANLGGAGGFHIGIKLAAELGYDYIWVMDDDCIPYADSLEKLMKADDVLGGPANYGYLSSAVLWTDGKECRMNRQKLKKAYYEKVHLLKESMIEVENSTFVSLLFPVETIRTVGLPIKEFFIWGDDIEFTRRITVRNQLPSYLVGNSQVVHAMKENTGSNIAIDVPERIDRYNYAFRNENYLYRQEGIKGFCYYTAKCGFNFLRVLFKARDHKCKRCILIIKCYFTGLFFNPTVDFLDERKK